MSLKLKIINKVTYTIIAIEATIYTHTEYSREIEKELHPDCRIQSIGVSIFIPSFCIFTALILHYWRINHGISIKVIAAENGKFPNGIYNVKAFKISGYQSLYIFIFVRFLLYFYLIVYSYSSNFFKHRKIKSNIVKI